MKQIDLKYYLIFSTAFSTALLMTTDSIRFAHAGSHLDTLAYASGAESSKIILHSAATGDIDNYIVKFKEGTPRTVSSRVVGNILARASSDISVQKLYQHVFDGFMATLTLEGVQQLANDPNVELIEQDTPVHMSQTQSPTPSWGLDRIDQARLPLDRAYHYASDGYGVNAYIVDTGLLSTHTEFTGRVGTGFSTVTDGFNTTDCNGHGTHVTGTIAGTHYGVAKNATVHPVRVLDCDGSGTTSGVISGLDWVKANAIHPAVANISLGGGPSATLDAAVTSVVQSGVTVAVAAGNSTDDACLESPSRVPSALSVGASTANDSRADYSNFGQCVTLFAPGTGITSSWLGADNNGQNMISGTSMAAPHVAGIVALYLTQNPTASPAQVRAELLKNAVKNVLSDVQGSPNLLVQTLMAVQPPDAPCTECTRYDGSLSHHGFSYEPHNSYYSVPTNGIQEFWLLSDENTVFAIELLKWAGSYWILTARTTIHSNQQHLIYRGTAGYYTVRVRSLSGASQYSLWIK